MKIRKIMLLVFSLIFALVLAYLVYNLLNTVTDENTHVEIEYIEVLIANKDIEEASIIESKDMRFIKLPKELAIGDYYTDKSEISGKYAAEKIYKGEYMHKARVIDDYSEKISRDIEYDKRAIAIYTDQYSAVADLLKPGDMVDLYVFIPEKSKGDEIIHPDLSKLIVQNIKVLSVDQDTVGISLPREETPDRYAITLEAHYKEVEQIVLAESIGYLKIALRPLGDDTIYLTSGSIWQELVSSYSGGKSIFIDEEEVVDEELGDEALIDVNIDLDKTNSHIKVSGDEADIYIVKSGDTLMNIAKYFYGDASKYTLIIDANNLSNPSHIVTGRRLKIPKIMD